MRKNHFRLSAEGSVVVNQSEDELQASCISYLELMYPKLLFFHVPNGGKRSKSEAARFKRMGVRPGIPDIFIDEACGGWHGLRIELKTGRNTPTREQTHILKQYRLKGYDTAVCYSFDEFRQVVDSYLRMKAPRTKLQEPRERQ